MAEYDDLDAGDDTRRNGDYIAYPHPDNEGDALSSVTINRGRLVTYDGTDLSEATSTTDDMFGVLQNYDVYGDTGKEKVGQEATVKTNGSVLANLGANFSPTVGTYLDDNANVFVNQQVGSTDVYEVILG